jgi:hypothetical protein
VAREVEEVGRAPADELVDRDALDRSRADGVAVVAVVDRQRRQRRADDEV